MSEPTITYNGVSSETLGLIVTRLPDFHRAQRRVTQTDIPGRSAGEICRGRSCGTTGRTAASRRTFASSAR